MPSSRIEDSQNIELYIAEVLKSADDLSWSSLEIARQSRGVRDDYHLSPARAGLLMPLKISGQQSVLEIGAGCGAITRYFGQTAGQVLAVEENPQRAHIAASRCRDLENVEVICRSVRNLSLDRTFDLVSLIDPLENFSQYFDDNNSLGNLLTIGSQWLKDTGVLVLATDNKLGLKYFAGLRDDDWGNCFEGIEGYPGRSGKCAFGKKELLILAEQAGFSATTMLCPFPDFRFPRTIINDQARLSLSKEPYLYQWLGYEIAPEGVGDRTYHLFRENLVLKQLEANGLLGDLANSFLLVASRSANGLECFLDARIQVYKYNLGRKREFTTKAALLQSKDGPEIVTQALFPEESGTAGPVARSLASEAEARPWLEGPTLMLRLAESIAFTKSDPDLSVRPILMRWYSHLKSRAYQGESGAELLPGRYWDCTLWNVIEQNDELIFFDRELEYKQPVPLKYVLFRGLLRVYDWMPISVERAYFNGKLPDRSFVVFAKHMMSLVGETLEEAEIDNYFQQEWQCNQQLGIKEAPPLDVCLRYWKGENQHLRLRNLQSLEQQLDYFQRQSAHLAEILSSQLEASWQQTAELQETISSLLEDSRRQTAELQKTISSQLEDSRRQTAELQETISNMSRSKFWQLRLLCLRIKSLLPWR